MRRILLLAATMTLALVLVGGVAISKQPQDQPDKGSGSIPRSTVVKASFASGSGTNFLGVKVSDHGNLLSFESPQGQENAFSDAEGYAVCSTQFGDETVGERVNGHDTGSVFGGFAAPTFSQPNGAGTFPLTVTRRTIDGKFQLTQVWNKPDTVEKDVTVAMTLKNISGAPINGVFLSRSGDFDVGSSSLDQGRPPPTPRGSGTTSAAARTAPGLARCSPPSPSGRATSRGSSHDQIGWRVEPARVALPRTTWRRRLQSRTSPCA
jgi:hypothetical protein